MSTAGNGAGPAEGGPEVDLQATVPAAAPGVPGPITFAPRPSRPLPGLCARCGAPTTGGAVGICGLCGYAVLEARARELRELVAAFVALSAGADSAAAVGERFAAWIPTYCPAGQLVAARELRAWAAGSGRPSWVGHDSWYRVARGKRRALALPVAAIALRCVPGWRVRLAAHVPEPLALDTYRWHRRALLSGIRFTRRLARQAGLADEQVMRLWRCARAEQRQLADLRAQRRATVAAEVAHA